MNRLNDTTWQKDKVKNPELDRNGEVKDDISVIIGDDKQPDFKPQIKLCRWTNEVNFSIRRKDYQEGTTKTTKDKVVWENSKEKIEFYEHTKGESGYKLVWFLKEKPLTNKVEFTIQSKGLNFYYQSELTQKEKDEGVERPENVVGSYAVYHDTKGRLNDNGGKDYKVGKAFHIYRPHIIDAEGNETWGILHIEGVIYSVEIPQEFLDKAVYPIKSNDTFGYTSIGETVRSIASNNTVQHKTSMKVGNPSNLSNPARVNKITVYLKSDPVTQTIDNSAFIYEKDSEATNSHGFITSIEKTNTEINTTGGWFDFTVNNEILYSGDYIMGAVGNGEDISPDDPTFRRSGMYYDESIGDDNTYLQSISNDIDGYDTLKASDPWSQGPNQFSGNGIYSVYATYGIVTEINSEKNIQLTGEKEYIPKSEVELWTDKTESQWGTGSSNSQDPYNTYYESSRSQFIILKSELEGIGLSSGGKILSFFLKCAELPGRGELKDFRIRIKHTSSSTTTGWETGWATEIFGPTTINNSGLSVGAWLEYVLISGFKWNGTDNVMVDISRTDTGWSSGGGMYRRASVGTQRNFAGRRDGTPRMYEYETGTTNGTQYDFTPSLKLKIEVNTNERSIELTGKLESNAERNIELIPQNTSTSERSLEIEVDKGITPVLSVAQVDSKIRLTWSYE